MATKGRNNHIVFSFLIVSLLLTEPCHSQTDKFLQGQVLKDGDELVSAFGNFRLGFFSTPHDTNRYLGIYYKIPANRMGLYEYDQYNDDFKIMDHSAGWSLQKTREKRILPVWVANRNIPILGNESASLAIDSTDGNLKIFRNGGNPIEISSVPRAGNTSATLLKTGNLVLYEMNLDGFSRELWQSFDHPTDTLLPGMKLGINLKTGQQWFLRSWSKNESPAEGLYTIGMDPNITDRLIIWKGRNVHCTSDMLQNIPYDFFGPVMYNYSYISNEGERYLSYSVHEDVTSFPVIQIFPEGELIDDLGRSIWCIVLGGCGSCLNVYDQFEVKNGFMDGPGLKFSESDTMNLTDCRDKCFNYFSCFCGAYAATNKYNNTGCQIWSRRMKFVEPHGRDKSAAGQIYLLVEPKEDKWWPRIIIAVVIAVSLLLSLGFLSRRKCKGKEEKWWMSLIIVVGKTLMLPMLCFVCIFPLKKMKAEVERIKNRQKLLRELGDNVSLPTIFGNQKTHSKELSMNPELKIFDFQAIAAATDDFSTANRLGQGGFGPVYKGKLLDGGEIAIKRLSKTSGQGIVEFKNEAKLVSKLQHTNLVRLLGCSLQGGERLLVYEYLPNKSLDFFIFEKDCNRKKLLNWKKRFNIIEGIVQGLLYLHKYSRLRVIHRDLKASNILLDDQMNPKISDFGMARTFAMNEIEANTNRIVGTHGYMSPEYVMHGIVSMKSDVFSFGVLVLEIVRGKKNHGCYHPDRPLNFIGYAWQMWNEGKGLGLIDPILMEESCSQNEVLRCIHVGLLCVQDRATDRPTMSDVVSMLTNETMVLPAPKQPAFFITIASDQEPKVAKVKIEMFSPNVVTISEMEPR